MTMGHLVVSVVVPCFRQARYLPHAIESVLAQTADDYEIIVVDDGSPDEIPEIAAGYPDVLCIRQENRGVAAARNTGMSAARGSFLVFLDADDRLLPNALAEGLACFRAFPEAALVWGRIEVIDEAGAPFEWIEPNGGRVTVGPMYAAEDHYWELLQSCVIWVPAAVMFRRTAVESLGGFNERLSPSDEWDLYLRIARRFPMRCHNALVAQYRRHAANVTNDFGLVLGSAIEVIEQQAPYVAENPRYRPAFEAGLRNIREYYGDSFVRELNDLLRRGLVERGDLERAASTLARYHPDGLNQLTAYTAR
jgi:glycosyltransferase involved in cell wall biosynthesis